MGHMAYKNSTASLFSSTFYVLFLGILSLPTVFITHTYRMVNDE